MAGERERLKLLIATHNRGKARELVRELEGALFDLLTLADLNISQDVEETGQTLEENARLKATTYAGLFGLWTLADDSGLEVEALGGEPGPRSRRYAGDDATDPERIRFLLKRLEGVQPAKRRARFRSVIAIVSPEGEVYTCEGTCEGEIALTPLGTGGFGYDPVFFIPELGKTMAELSLEEKNQVSHRGKAARKAAEALKSLDREFNRSLQRE
ncbi:MAG: RdgB/HAM1 family non-canonical purine NTP pyrophosphatase [Chloroflexi bacterium]|nr:RdgB/HAM1 family non-canonical purine NTP pyrophosphatase [Chloroflexota bacterium]